MVLTGWWLDPIICLGGEPSATSWGHWGMPLEGCSHKGVAWLSCAWPSCFFCFLAFPVILPLHAVCVHWTSQWQDCQILDCEPPKTVSQNKLFSFLSSSLQGFENNKRLSNVGNWVLRSRSDTINHTWGCGSIFGIDLQEMLEEWGKACRKLRMLQAGLVGFDEGLEDKNGGGSVNSEGQAETV